jgi:hypothetical protein
MKVLYFIKWCWNKFLEELKDWEHWQWGTIVTMFFFGGAMIGPENAYSRFCANMLVAIGIFYWACYVVIFKSVQRAWKRFNDEQTKILNHIKDGE